MSQYIYTNDGLISEDDLLTHYGVMGMKWGVRHGRASRAFRKASKKANKLTEKQVSTNLKGAKLQKKAFKKGSKATSSKQIKKATKLYAKANKNNLKSAKLQKKALKWVKKMEKAFKNTPASDIREEDKALGRRYLYMLRG